MTARGSSPTHEALDAARDANPRHDGFFPMTFATITDFEHSIAAAYAVDLPALRREAAALALEEAAREARAIWEGDRWPGIKDVIDWIESKAELARAQALREGKD